MLGVPDISTSRKCYTGRGEIIVIFAALLIATIMLIILTLLPMWRCEAWWVRSLDFPRLQLWAISMLLLLTEMILLDLSHFTTWGLLVATLLCLAYHAWWILPYTRVFPVEVKSAVSTAGGPSLRIMTANVLTPIETQRI